MRISASDARCRPTHALTSTECEVTAGACECEAGDLEGDGSGSWHSFPSLMLNLKIIRNIQEMVGRKDETDNKLV